MRFAIRDLLWLTVVVAMACGWFLSSWSWTIRFNQATSSQRRYIKELESNIPAMEKVWGKYLLKEIKMEKQIKEQNELIEQLKAELAKQ